MGKVISVLLLMHLNLLERKFSLLTGRKILYAIVVYTLSPNSCTYKLTVRAGCFCHALFVPA